MRERPFQRGDFPQHDPEGVGIGVEVVGPGVPVLRGHVADAPGAGGEFVRSVGAFVLLVTFFREAEVEELDVPTGIEPHVLRLDVAIDNVELVEVVQRPRQVLHHCHPLVPQRPELPRAIPNEYAVHQMIPLLLPRPLDPIAQRIVQSIQHQKVPGTEHIALSHRAQFENVVVVEDAQKVRFRGHVHGGLEEFFEVVLDDVGGDDFDGVPCLAGGVGGVRGEVGLVAGVSSVVGGVDDGRGEGRGVFLFFGMRRGVGCCAIVRGGGFENDAPLSVAHDTGIVILLLLPLLLPIFPIQRKRTIHQRQRRDDIVLLQLLGTDGILALVSRLAVPPRHEGKVARGALPGDSWLFVAIPSSSFRWIRSGLLRTGSSAVVVHSSVIVCGFAHRRPTGIVIAHFL
mmetsp:Transcript_30794/g.65129  ORF Transcript_30794/g.65129 Transcript_30794/m.65129 type:complete len:399 (+) Transcript_30794:302-1498(+)